MPTSDVDAFKSHQREMWSAGEYDLIAQRIASAGEVVVQAAQIEPGMTVLDVATGTGNAAIPAAKAGGVVTGLDLTPELFGPARKHAEEAGVEIDWVEGDAEALPFEDESFDRVLSVFGVMFAPQQKIAANELARVCKPGGSVVLANWLPGSFIGRLIGVISRHLPPPPEGTPSPLLWGDERYPRKLLGGQLLLAQHVHAVDIDPPSRDLMVAMFNHAFGPLIVARKVLGDEAFEAILDDFRALITEFDPGEGELHFKSEYLLTVAHRPAA